MQIVLACTAVECLIISSKHIKDARFTSGFRDAGISIGWLVAGVVITYLSAVI